MNRWISKIIIVLCIFVAVPYSAVSDTCGNSVFIGGCCNATLSECISRKDSCDLAQRLERFRVWLHEHAKPCTTIAADLDSRYRTLMDTTAFDIDVSGVTFAGLKSAPVDIIMYISMSCPLCKRLYKEMYGAVVSGELKGRAKLAAKPFSISPMDRALVASARWGKQENILLALGPVTKRLTLDLVLSIADSLGIQRDSLERVLKSPAVRQFASDSQAEATRNGVEVTPTFFIGGRRYRSYKDSRWVIDAAEFWSGP